VRHTYPGARRAATLLAALALLGVLPAAPGAAASPAGCIVTNIDTWAQAATIPAVVATADPGDTLIVRGICKGDVTLDRNLTIVGIHPVGAKRPVLLGDGNGSALRIDNGVTATIVAMRISGGNNVELGGGIYVDGTLTLRDTVVRANQAGSGGGIYVDSGDLVLRGATAIQANKATYGAGISIDGGTITLHGQSSIRGNRASGLGGGLLTAQATVTFNDTSSVRQNQASSGGGVFNDFGSTLVFTENTTVQDNVALRFGGGIYAEGTVILQDQAVVRGNKSSSPGSGAVELARFPSESMSFTMAGNSAVTANVGGSQGGGVVSWQGCGGGSPALSGVVDRTFSNSPKQVVLAAGCPTF